MVSSRLYNCLSFRNHTWITDEKEDFAAKVQTGEQNLLSQETTNESAGGDFYFFNFYYLFCIDVP